MKVLKWMWHKQFECVVELIKTGHFPTSSIVRLPDDRVVETDNEHLVRPDEVNSL